MCLIFTILFANSVTAQVIPDNLNQWKDWVKYEQEFYDCPYFYNKNSQSKSAHVCAWPSTLTLKIQNNSADFTINWEIIQDSWINLPGDTKSWPQEVKVNQKTQAVQRHKNQPRVYLKKGSYTITGRFLWEERPENLTVPANIADITLTIDDKSINFPQRKSQSLWLGENNETSKIESNKLEFDVNRLIIDGHPMNMYVVLDLYVSGSARNEKLGKIGNQQLQVTDLSGNVSAYIDSDGYLWAQLRPGDWQIKISFNILNWPEKIAFNANGKYWPKQEIWAYQDNKNIRITQIKGGQPINPDQTNSQWDEVPNFLLNSGDVFEIIQQKRGTLNQTAQLNLYRTIWLAFNGDSFRSQDEIKGEKLGNWRLNARQGYQLLNAKSHNENMLITQSVEGNQGLELRTPAIDLIVNTEFPPITLEHISPWKASFDYIKTDMYLPYGYMAFAVNNVDVTAGIWIEKWKLWDIFIVMLMTVFCYKVINFRTAIVAFFTLILGYHESAMPLIAWANIVIIVAMLAAKPTGKILTLIRSYALVSIIGLLMILVPFIINQVRLTIHPQLETNISYAHSGGSVSNFSNKRAPLKELNKSFSQTYNNMNAIVSTDSSEESFEELDRITVTGSMIKQSDLINRYQTGAVLQAGKGLPQWHSNHISLQWDGPINNNQKFKLYLIPPALRIIWRLLLVITSIFWLMFLLKKLREGIKTKQIHKVSSATIFLLLCNFPNILFAQNYPQADLLDKLHDRLYQQSPCLSNCASLDSSKVIVNGIKLQMELEYHAFDDVAIAIPHSKDWHIENVFINNKLQNNRISYKNTPWIQVNKGINHIKLTGILAKRNNISLIFPITPGSITTQSKGWQIAGIDGNTLSNNTLQLISTVQDAQTTEQSQSTDIKPFVNVIRSITFDDSWYVTTTVQRIAPKHGAINITIPLINNEHPTDKMQVDNDGNIIVSLSPIQIDYSWSSRLDRTQVINLTAADDSQYLETWNLLASPQWNIDISGIAIISPANFDIYMDDYFTHTYKPRPGEALEVKINRPDAIMGEIVSIESISNLFSVGKRTTKSLTTIHYRATQGGDFQINIDKMANINNVAYDGVDSNLTNEDGVISVSFLPGKHKVVIDWQVNKSLNIINKTPFISLNNNYTNIDQKINIPRSRWVLYGNSKGIGPAFLYWGEFLFFTILAFFLARLPYSMLKFWQWLVLGYAFGTVSWFAFGFIAMWLFYIGWKKQQPMDNKSFKNISLQWFTLFFSITAIMVFIGSVAFGLFSYPQMGIAGMRSSASNLNWFIDSYQNSIPNITIISVPIWWYKALMLIWSIWVSFSLLNWLNQVIKGFDKNLWWKKKKKAVTPTIKKKDESIKTKNKTET